MLPIITQPGVPAHVHPDEAARKRGERLARATAEQAEAALAFLSVIDPLMFEIAMDAGAQTVGGAPEEEDPEDEEPIPVCRRCGGQVGIFLDRGPAVAALPRGRDHVRRPGDLRPRPLRRGHLAPPRRGPGRAVAEGSHLVPAEPVPGSAGRRDAARVPEAGESAPLVLPGR